MRCDTVVGPDNPYLHVSSGPLPVHPPAPANPSICPQVYPLMTSPNQSAFIVPAAYGTAGNASWTRASPWCCGGTSLADCDACMVCVCDDWLPTASPIVMQLQPPPPPLSAAAVLLHSLPPLSPRGTHVAALLDVYPPPTTTHAYAHVTHTHTHAAHARSTRMGRPTRYTQVHNALAHPRAHITHTHYFFTRLIYSHWYARVRPLHP